MLGNVHPFSRSALHPSSRDPFSGSPIPRYSRIILSVNKIDSQHNELIRRPEELVYRSCYAPADLEKMLESADTRSLIRRLPPAQVYFSLQTLDDEQIGRLLLHLTEEQWTTVLDLDLWRKDRVDLPAFLGWQRHLIQAEDPVARKLIRATDSQLWQTFLVKTLEIFPRTEEDEFEGEPVDREAVVTPDGGFLIGLPRNPEMARVTRELLVRLYQLDADWTRTLILQAYMRTPSEVEEEAYQNRRRRIEDLGFQDYFDAIEIYTPLALTDILPEKRWERRGEPTVLPAGVKRLGDQGPMLLFQAMATLDSEPLELLVEELFFVCNKLLSADRVAPGKPQNIKHGIRKALSGINLGLSVWSRDELGKAAAGLRRHFLVSFFQLGFGQLSELRKQAEALRARQGAPEAGSYSEALLEGFLRRFPVLTYRRKGRIRRRPIQSRGDMQRAFERLGKLRSG